MLVTVRPDIHRKRRRKQGLEGLDGHVLISVWSSLAFLGCPALTFMTIL